MSKIICRYCGKEFETYRGKFCSRLCFRKYMTGRTGSKNNNWQGGKSRLPKCLDCKKQLNRRSLRCKPCHSEFSKGKNSPNWKGGKIGSGSGYIYIYSPNHPQRNKDNYVFEHRRVFEKQIGRYLTRREVIHHCNGVRDDNRVENLKLFENNTEHRKNHAENFLKE